MQEFKFIPASSFNIQASKFFVVHPFIFTIQKIEKDDLLCDDTHIFRIYNMKTKILCEMNDVINIEQIKNRIVLYTKKCVKIVLVEENNVKKEMVIYNEMLDDNNKDTVEDVENNTKVENKDDEDVNCATENNHYIQKVGFAMDYIILLYKNRIVIKEMNKILENDNSEALCVIEEITTFSNSDNFILLEKDDMLYKFNFDSLISNEEINTNIKKYELHKYVLQKNSENEFILKSITNTVKPKIVIHKNEIEYYTIINDSILYIKKDKIYICDEKDVTNELENELHYENDTNVQSSKYFTTCIDNLVVLGNDKSEFFMYLFNAKVEEINAKYALKLEMDEEFECLHAKEIRTSDNYVYIRNENNITSYANRKEIEIAEIDERIELGGEYKKDEECENVKVSLLDNAKEINNVDNKDQNLIDISNDITNEKQTESDMDNEVKNIINTYKESDKDDKGIEKEDMSEKQDNFKFDKSTLICDDKDLMQDLDSINLTKDSYQTKPIVKEAKIIVEPITSEFEKLRLEIENETLSFINEFNSLKINEIETKKYSSSSNETLNDLLQNVYKCIQDIENNNLENEMECILNRIEMFVNETEHDKVKENIKYFDFYIRNMKKKDFFVSTVFNGEIIKGLEKLKIRNDNKRLYEEFEDKLDKMSIQEELSTSNKVDGTYKSDTYDSNRSIISNTDKIRGYNATQQNNNSNENLDAINNVQTNNKPNDINTNIKQQTGDINKTQTSYNNPFDLLKNNITSNKNSFNLQTSDNNLFNIQTSNTNPFNIQARNTNPFNIQANNTNPFNTQANNANPFNIQATNANPFNIQASNTNMSGNQNAQNSPNHDVPKSGGSALSKFANNINKWSKM
ncbi:hypothetical protein BDAP_002264 [Binucleata daphniae]